MIRFNEKWPFLCFGLILGGISVSSWAGADPCADLYTRFTLNGKSFLTPADVHSSSDGLYIVTNGKAGSPHPNGQKYRVELYPDKNRGFGTYEWCFERVDYSDEDHPTSNLECPFRGRSKLIYDDDGKTVLGQVTLNPTANTVTLEKNAEKYPSPNFKALPGKLVMTVKIGSTRDEARFDTSLSVLNERDSVIARFQNHMSTFKGKEDPRPLITDLSLIDHQEYSRNGCGKKYQLSKTPSSPDDPTAKQANPAKN